MSVPSSQSFSELLRCLRIAARLTQEALAERSGVSERNIRALERGWSKPQRDTARRLATGLGLSGEELAEFLAAAAPLPRRRPSTGDRLSVSASVPLPATALVAREGELAAVQALIERDDVRVLTLTGPGGVGKTCLALQSAFLLQQTFADGVVFVALESVADPALVLPTIARAADMPEERGGPILSNLVGAWRDKRLLLVLDNFEHVVEAAPAVARLRATCPGLRFLVTSRAALRLQGEQVYPVPPLAVASPHHLPPLDVLGRIPAVRLFVERARAVRPDFVLTASNAEAVAAIGADLDGLPLAIELAAARVAIMPAQALLRRLRDDQGRLSFQLLAGGGRDLPPRQRTLRNTIAWSVDLLAGAERELFRRLGVFHGGWSWEAAEAICGASLSTDVQEGLSSLAEKSLLSARDEGGEARFGMLATIREYALEQLEAVGEAESFRDSHASYYLALARAAERGIRGRDQGTWFDRLERERDNFRAALSWFSERGDTEACLGLETALFWVWHLRGSRSEGRSWVEATLAQMPVTERGTARATALAIAGALATALGDFPTARCQLEESVSIWRVARDRSGLAFALTHLAVLTTTQGDFGRGRALTEEALAVARAAGDDLIIALAVHGLGALALLEGNYAEARPLLEESLQLWRELRGPAGLALVLNTLGDLARAEGDDGGAAAYYGESLEMAAEMGSMAQQASCLHNLGYIAHRRGDDRQAREYFRKALLLFRDLSDLRAVADCIAGLATVDVERDPGRAVRLFGAAMAAVEALEGRLYPSNQADYERALATVRDRLTEDAFAVAWAKGRAMTMVQASNHALAEP